MRSGTMSTPARELTEVELLATEDQLRLADALTDALPLPASQAEECKQLLDQQAKRRIVTVDDHRRFHVWSRTGEAVDRDDDLQDLLTELRAVRREDA